MIPFVLTVLVVLVGVGFIAYRTLPWSKGECIPNKELSTRIAIAIDSKINNPVVPCVEAFEILAGRDSGALVMWIRSGSLEPSDLGDAVETLGRCCVGTVVIITTLLMYSKHSSRFVREGAVCGMGHHLYNLQIRSRLHKMLEDETSEGVKSTIRDLMWWSHD